MRSAEKDHDAIHRFAIRLVDGGLADNLGLRGVLESLEEIETVYDAYRPRWLDHVRRIIVFIVNSLSSPKTNWNASERAPGDVAILLKALGMPIDHYSYEAVDLLRDTVARWQATHRIRDSGALAGNTDPAIAQFVNAPNIDLYAIDVSLPALRDKTEFEYLNNLPTAFVLPPEAVDRLRAAATTVILSSPEFQRLLKDSGAKVVAAPSAAGGSATAQ